MDGCQHPCCVLASRRIHVAIVWTGLGQASDSYPIVGRCFAKRLFMPRVSFKVFLLSPERDDRDHEGGNPGVQDNRSPNVGVPVSH